MARRGVGVLGLLSGLLILVGATTVAEAQTPKEGARGYNAARRVPAYFGQVGLSESQREEIYDIRAKYREQIAALKRQLEELETQENTDCAKVLSESQRKLLETLRAARSKVERTSLAKEEAAAEPSPATAPKAEPKPEAPKGEETQEKKGT